MPAEMPTPMSRISQASILPCWLLLAFFVVFTSFGLTGRINAQTFEIDNDHTSLVFAVSHSGLSYTYGRFNKCSGRVTVSDVMDDQAFSFTVDADSIDTNNRLRDDHLKGPDFFDVQAFPEIKFRSARVSNVEDTYIAEGVLDMHGVKKNITIELTKIGTGKGPRGETRIGFFSKFTVKRSNFGIKSLPTIIGDQIAITLSFEGILRPQKNAETGKLQPQHDSKSQTNSPIHSSIKSRLKFPNKRSFAQPVAVEKEYQILER